MADADRLQGAAKTRILATLGPNSSDPATIEAMVRAGANAFRLNFSHGTHEQHEKNVRMVRKIGRKLGVPLAIMQDLQGPKIRTGPIKDDNDPIMLEEGTTVRLSPRIRYSREGAISTTYADIAKDVKKGNRILIDDGRIELYCESVSDGELVCEVVNGGPLKSNKGINLPGVNVSAPSMTPKDRRDLEFGARVGVDWIALSFVRTADDVRALRAQIYKLDADVAIIAKIEKPEAVDNIADILEASEGIMVARGDLGVEVPLEHLPLMQKEIIAAARERGRVVITATQMLESMIDAPIPTRAEATDVANAILDGTDAVMLSGETAVGDYPVEAIATMLAIASHVEGSELYDRVMRDLPLDPGRDVADATVHAACTASRELGARVIVAFTSSGRTCFKVSFARPRTRIIGATFSERSFNRLALCWGIEAVCLKEAKTVDELYFLGEKHMLEDHHVEPGEMTVIITGSNIGAGGTNSIKIHRTGVVDLTDDSRVAARFNRLYARLGI